MFFDHKPTVKEVKRKALLEIIKTDYGEKMKGGLSESEILLFDMDCLSLWFDDNYDYDEKTDFSKEPKLGKLYNFLLSYYFGDDIMMVVKIGEIGEDFIALQFESTFQTYKGKYKRENWKYIEG